MSAPIIYSQTYTHKRKTCGDQTCHLKEKLLYLVKISMHFFTNAVLHSLFEKYVGSKKQIKGKGISCLLKRMFLCNHSVLEKKIIWPRTGV